MPNGHRESGPRVRPVHGRAALDRGGPAGAGVDRRAPRAAALGSAAGRYDVVPPTRAALAPRCGGAGFARIPRDVLTVHVPHETF
jgi:hypothetical protein